ncbi:TomO hydrophobic C-terminal domain-containing protein [Wolbachia endosymbiont (group A) of Ancistrocerus nigricornis]|uniref:TomO hydrophobic C-terminal domain-containing protein n=1 Tax=Wolbachia endosymbiont (group A) of Ancistrocerus nigricornis TaxID=2953974 RepID=UPI00222787DF|nr:hypothetical protein [Wolbachia endosymbiont (group A) of Ancistrocerus nigricornis]
MPNSGDQSTSSNNTGSNSTLTTTPEITGCEKKLGVSEVSSNADNVSTIGGVINSKEKPAAVEKTSAINNQSTSITATQNTQKSKCPTIATWTLAVSGVVSGVAIAVYLEMLAAGIAVGACCLVAAPVIYCCTPKSQVENNKVDKPFNTGKVPTAVHV